LLTGVEFESKKTAFREGDVIVVEDLMPMPFFRSTEFASGRKAWLGL
jgi:hypothetical protein